MSTNSSEVGMVFFGFTSAESWSSRVSGTGHHAHVGLDGAERVVRRLRPGVGERVEQGGLAHVGQPHDADSQCHGRVSNQRLLLRGRPRRAGGLAHLGQVLGGQLLLLRARPASR